MRKFSRQYSITKTARMLASVMKLKMSCPKRRWRGGMCKEEWQGQFPDKKVKRCFKNQFCNIVAHHIVVVGCVVFKVDILGDCANLQLL
jgi:hypothetical protein